MANTRLEALKSMVALNPADSFSRYGLAMEYRNSGDAEAAVAEFRALIAVDPGYAYAYFHAGQTLECLDRPDEARELYRQGIEAAQGKGDRHAQSELQGALDLLG
jgi:tetratricopeptide (TPR) repeat protein